MPITYLGGKRGHPLTVVASQIAHWMHLCPAIWLIHKQWKRFLPGVVTFVARFQCRPHYVSTTIIVSTSSYNHNKETAVHVNTPLRYISRRLCPNLDLIQAHLRNSTGFEGTITASNKICFSCYKSHLVTLQKGTRTSKTQKQARTMI